MFITNSTTECKKLDFKESECRELDSRESECKESDSLEYQRLLLGLYIFFYSLRYNL